MRGEGDEALYKIKGFRGAEPRNIKNLWIHLSAECITKVKYTIYHISKTKRHTKKSQELKNPYQNIADLFCFSSQLNKKFWFLNNFYLWIWWSDEDHRSITEDFKIWRFLEETNIPLRENPIPQQQLGIIIIVDGHNSC